MIIGLGCDIAQVSRFSHEESFLLRFCEKYFTCSEIEEIKSRNHTSDIHKIVQAVATKFSGKEAVSKALGSGFQKGITLKDIEILHDNLGKPVVNLYNLAKQRAESLAMQKKYNIHLSLSNEKEYVNAVAIIEIY